VHARQRHAHENVVAEELERAVHVSPSATEQQANESVVDPRNEEASRRVGALYSVSHDRVGSVALRDEQRKVLERELAITVVKKTQDFVAATRPDRTAPP